MGIVYGREDNAFFIVYTTFKQSNPLPAQNTYARKYFHSRFFSIFGGNLVRKILLQVVSIFIINYVSDKISS